MCHVSGYHSLKLEEIRAREARKMVEEQRKLVEKEIELEKLKHFDKNLDHEARVTDIQQTKDCKCNSG